MGKKAQKTMSRLQTRKAVVWVWAVVTGPFAILILMLALTSMGLFGKLPSFEELENPKSNIATEIYTEDGVMIGSFYVQNRSYVTYDELSPALVAALVSTEDARYYSHSGIDFISLVRVAVKTLGLGMRQGGGSTISQQLAKNLFPREEPGSNRAVKTTRLFVTKLKEWITAVKLEYNYTKEEIIAMYLNTVEYGSNAFGIKSAAQTFFNKAPIDINTQEAAVLIGVVNAPTKYSPVRNYERSRARRNTVISRMYDRGYIDGRAQRDSLLQLPIELNFRPISHNQGSGTYFREMLRLTMNQRKPARNQFAPGVAGDWNYREALDTWETNPLNGWCQKNLKADGMPYDIYRDGLKIYTTVNSSMQEYAEKAVRDQLRDNIQPRMEEQYKYYKQLFFNTSKKDVERIINNAMRYTERYRGLSEEGATSEEIEKDFNTPTELKVFSYGGDIDTLMTPRDSILYHKRILRASFMAMDPYTGYVKAYVGGPDFRYFQYDMVRQGRRQVGSTIKPFIYSFAIDHLGYTPCTMVPNLPVTIETQTGDAWQPKEASRVEYDGDPRPLKWGLANSRNNYSAWIMKQAKQPAAVADFIHRMGISSYIDPVYALCLGTSDLSLYEMVAAYSTFVNRGVYNDPIFVTRIEDRFGNVIATFTNTSNDAMGEDTSYTMLGMLGNVVNAGTAGRIRRAPYAFTGEMGGKTGTSQDNADAWFMGVTPRLVTGAWVGGEDPGIHLLRGGEGAAMALPIFGDFMKQVYGNPKLGISQSDRFNVPGGLGLYDCSREQSAAEARTATADEFFD